MKTLPENVSQKERRVLGPIGRFLMKLFRWEIEGNIPNLKKMILVGVPHTAMRDAWYALLAVLALDLKINFFGAAWIFTRLPSLVTISKNLDKLGIPWPFWWIQKYVLIRLGGIPVYRVNSRGLIHGAVEEFDKIDNYVLVIAPEGGTEAVCGIVFGFVELFGSESLSQVLMMLISIFCILGEHECLSHLLGLGYDDMC